jgi:hypothetical protein
MSFLSKLFGGEQTPRPIETYADFWAWFVEHEAEFHEIVRSKDTSKIEKDFFGPLGSKLRQIKDGIFFLVGMIDDKTVDMIFTADGNPKNIAFVGELVDAAPNVPGWEFKSSKPAASGFVTAIDGVKVDENSLSFYPNDDADKPDLVNITLVHEAFGGPTAEKAKHGAFIFLDSYLGEINFMANIDDLEFRSPAEAEKDLIPIEALPNYIETRQALFVEKYDGVRIFTENDAYSMMEGTTANGLPLIATINTDLMKWDKKASHPWMLVVTIPYKGNDNGMPDSDTGSRMYEIEHAFEDELKDVDGYLNIGRQTRDNARHIFFACVDFRLPSKVAHRLQLKYISSLSFEYEIFKDKYWRAVSHFAPSEPHK